MTERLATLMHDAADGLRVPPAPGGAVVARGRAVRRRRRLARVAVGGTLVLVVGGGAGLAVAHPRADHRHEAVEVSVPAGAVWSSGTTLWYDDGRASVRIDDAAIKSLYYTSAGVVVRHGENNQSDGGGPMRFSLVAPDGAVSELPLTVEETAPSTDPTQPYLAYATLGHGPLEVVVVDVRDGEEVARVAVPGAQTGGSPPGVSLDGDEVYVGGEPNHVVDWRTGAVRDSPTTGFIPSVHRGRTVTTGPDGMAQVTGVADGRMQVAAVSKRDRIALSPDGRYALIASGPGDPFLVDLDHQDADRQHPLDLTGRPWEFGWGPDDSVFTVTGRTLTTCAPTTGVCTERTLEASVDPDTVRLGGLTYES